MPSDNTFEDKWQEFEAAVRSSPSVADDVMRRIAEKPIPARRRRSTRSLAMAACAAAILGIAGVTIASWIVADGPDGDTAALDPADRHAPRPTEDETPPEQTQHEGTGPRLYTPGFPDLPRAGDVATDQLDGRQETVVGTQPGSDAGVGRLTPLPNARDGERAIRVPMPNTGPDGRTGAKPFGRPSIAPAGGPDGRHGELFLEEPAQARPDAAETARSPDRELKKRRFPWGERVEGLQCRLRAEKTVWTISELKRPGGAVRCKVDFRNRSDQAWSYLYPQVANQHVEWDGRWHRMIRRIPAYMRPLPPGEVVRDVDCSIGANVILAADDSPDQSKADLAIGWHTVRTAIHFSSGDRTVKVVSNPVKIQIVRASGPAETPKGRAAASSTEPPQDEPPIEPPPLKDEPPTDAPPPVSETKAPPTEPPPPRRRKQRQKRELPWGEQVEGLQCRLRAEKTAWTISELKRPGGAVRCKVDFRNRSDGTWSYLHPQAAEQHVEWDGRWHRTIRLIPATMRPLPPGEVVRDVDCSIGADVIWAADVSPGPSKAKPAIGWHTVRTAVHFSSGDRKIKVVSNPVEIESVASDEGRATVQASLLSLAGPMYGGRPTGAPIPRERASAAAHWPCKPH
jgi:hypothetical protein